MAGCSFISEWPPPSEEHDFVCSPIKRRKTSDISPLVYSSPHSKIDVILAKWWKLKKKDLEPSIVKSSINPSTVLYNISRYMTSNGKDWKIIREFAKISKTFISLQKVRSAL